MFAAPLAGLAPALSRLRLAMMAPLVAPLMAALLLVPATAALAASAGEATTPPVRDIKFSQFFRLPVGDQGLALSDTLLAADGQDVRLVGYMVSQEQPRPGRFWLTPRPVRMSEHADGEADDLPPATVTVLLDPAQQDRLVAHRDGLLVLTGRLRVGRAEDDTGRVSWVRLELAPEALASQPGAPAAAPHHSH